MDAAQLVVDSPVAAVAGKGLDHREHGLGPRAARGLEQEPAAREEKARVFLLLLRLAGPPHGPLFVQIVNLDVDDQQGRPPRLERRALAGGVRGLRTEVGLLGLARAGRSDWWRVLAV